MATVIGSIATSHIPSIGNAISKGLQDDPYWKPFFEGYKDVHTWLNDVKPDVAVTDYNDHGLNFFLDNLPTFSVGAAPQYSVEDEGWGLPTFPPYRGFPELSWHIIESMVRDEFDISTCQEMASVTAHSADLQAAIHITAEFANERLVAQIEDAHARVIGRDQDAFFARFGHWHGCNAGHFARIVRIGRQPGGLLV